MASRSSTAVSGIVHAEIPDSEKTNFATAVPCESMEQPRPACFCSRLAALTTCERDDASAIADQAVDARRLRRQAQNEPATYLRLGQLESRCRLGHTPLVPSRFKIIRMNPCRPRNPDGTQFRLRIGGLVTVPPRVSAAPKHCRINLHASSVSCTQAGSSTTDLHADPAIFSASIAFSMTSSA